MCIHLKHTQLSDQYFDMYWYHVSVTDCESDKDFMNMYDGCAFE